MTIAKPPSHRVQREDVVLWLLVFTPVLAWIAAQQLSFLATRSMCANGHRATLYLVMGPAFAAAAGAGAASWTKWRAFAPRKSTDRIRMYRGFLALGGVLLAAICAVSIVALMIPAGIHRLCD